MRLEIRYKQKENVALHEAERGCVWLSFPKLDQTGLVMNGFSTRLGGVSEGMFSSMNLSFTRGDVDEHVTENYRILGRAMGFDPECLVTSNQTHTTNLRVVGKEEMGEGFSRPRAMPDIDGLLTNEPGVVLSTSYADCVPLFFVDPVHKAIALSHSGWRGTVNRMGRVTLERMQREYGSRPEDLLVAIGPSICQDCYEVGEDVIEEIRKGFTEEVLERTVRPNERGRYQLDLWGLNREIFLEAGLKEEQIQMPGLCTCCNPDFLFSHRASQGKRGNLGAFLMLR